PRRVAGERVAAGVRACRVQGEELLGQVVDGLADALLGAEPFRATELGQCRPLAARVAGDPPDLLDRDKDPVATGERELEVVALLPARAAPEHLLVPGDAVVDMDHEVARDQALEDVARYHPPQRPWPPDPDRAKELAIGDEGQTVRAPAKAAVEAAIDERHRAGRGRLPEAADDGGGVTGLPEDVGEPRRLVRGHHDPRAVLLPALDGFGDPSGATGR